MFSVLARKLPRVNGILFNEAFVDDGMSEVVTRTFSDVVRGVKFLLDFGVVWVVVDDTVSTGVLRVALNRLVIPSVLTGDCVDALVLRLKLDLGVDAFSTDFFSADSDETSKFLL